MIELKYPAALLLIFFPFLIWVLQKNTRSKLVPIRTPLYDQWLALNASAPQSNRFFWKRLIQFLIWCCLIAALSRPQWVDEPIELPTSGRDLLLSIDISGSMEEEDLKLDGKPVNRLTVVKSIVNEFIDERQGDRIGLVLFGENAYLQTPLTFDLTTVKTMLQETEIGLAGAARTAIGDGIGLAIKRLRERPEQNRVLILLTDGRNNSGELDPVEAAKLANHAGIKIYTIGVGADEVIRRSLLFGTTKFNPSAELDEKTLTQVANITGGKYFRARSTEELKQIYNILDELEPVEDEPEIFRPVQELYYVPALGALSLIIGSLLLSIIVSIASGSFRKNNSSKKNVTDSPSTVSSRPTISSTSAEVNRGV